MSLELILSDNDCLRKQLAAVRKELIEKDRKCCFLQRQVSLVQDLVGEIDATLLSLAGKLHLKEIILVNNRFISLDSAAFQDLVSDIGKIKEKMQGLHSVLESEMSPANAAESQVSSNSYMSNAAPAAAAAESAASAGASRSCNSRSPLAIAGSQNLAPPPSSATATSGATAATAFRKQISWDPSTEPGTSATAASLSREGFDDNREEEEDGDNIDGCDDEGSSSASSQSLQDGILASASAGMIGLKTLQLFSKRSDTQQGPESQRWYNRLRCCSFQECAVVIHLIYLHLISIVAIGGITFLIIGIMLERKECLVAGTVMVIASYGLFLNHCFYRSAAVSSRPAAQKLRIKEHDSIDLEASTSETINIDLTRPPTRNILQVDLDSSQLSRAY